VSNEIWRAVVGYEGLYEVSNLGNVRSLNYGNTGKCKLLKLCFDKYGYLQVGLCKNKKRKMCRVHRLVAITFILNLMKYPAVNHKDENKINNKVENLEWCTVEYNNAYGKHQERVNKSRKGYRHSEETKNKMRLKAIERNRKLVLEKEYELQRTI
jgi:hypothetical protein